MKRFLTTIVAVAALAGAALFATSPAQAGVSLSFSIGIPNAVAFDYDSGGYCDDWGCPDEYWDMPVYYGPVYYRGGWYQGPVYYRDYGGTRWYWIRGGWRRDEWRGPRPRWWKANYRVGPALGYSFYLRNGFRHDRDRYWRGNDWHPGRDWDRDRSRNWDRDRGKIRIDERIRDDRHDNDRHDNDRGNDSHGGSGDMTGPGNGHHSGAGMTGPGGGAMTGPGGGAMMGPGGGKPNGGAMMGPGGGKPNGGAMMGPGGGSMSGPSGGANPSGDKPKHKHGDNNDGH
jgi:hypothetical protein